MNKKFKREKSLNESGRAVLHTYNEIENGLSDFMQKTAKDYLKITFGIDYDSLVSGISDEVELKETLGKLKKFTDDNYSEQLINFAHKYLNEDDLKIKLESNNKQLTIIKMIGFNKAKFTSLYEINPSDYNSFNRNDYVSNFVNLEIRRVIKNQLKDWTFDKNINIEISNVYNNKMYTNIDLSFSIIEKNLDSDKLKEIEIFIIALNDFLKNEYNL